jgi:hypothetical protein
LDYKEILEDNPFLKDVVSLEAQTLLQDLKSEFLHVILMPAPDPRHTDHKIRRAINFNS